MTERLHIISEHVDDIPLLLAQPAQMGVQSLLDGHFPTHGNWVGPSLGWVIVLWLTHVLSEAGHRLNHVERWAVQWLHMLRGCTRQPIHPLDLGDDCLAGVLEALSGDESCAALEGALNRQWLGVYDLQPECVRTVRGSVPILPNRHKNERTMSFELANSVERALGYSMNVLVTGASGFLGRNFILQAPTTWRILAVYNHDLSFPTFISRAAKGNVIPVRCDLTDARQVATMLDERGHEWETCLYLAAKADIPWSVRKPAEDLRINAGSLLNLLGELRTNQFLFVSSGSVYDGLEGEVHPGIRVNPTLPYAISKLACEHYLRSYHERYRTIENYLILRFFGAYGPYEPSHKIYNRLIRALAFEGKKAYTIYGDGNNLVDAMYVDDTIEALLRIMMGNHWNEIIDLTAGNRMTLESLVQEVGKALGLNFVHIEKQDIAHENIRFWASIEKVRAFYGFEPKVKLDEGIKRFLDFLMRADHEGENTR